MPLFFQMFIFLQCLNIKKKNMNKKVFTSRFWFVLTIIATGAAMRLVPHWPNFTPIAAIALFGGAYMTRKHLAFIIPMAAMLLSDLFLGFHSTMIAVYIGFAITVSLGLLIARKPKALNIVAASFASTVIFFLITNFGSWLSSPMYAKDFTGLMQSYAAGLAFFNDGSQGISFFVNSLVGDLFYNTVFFGVFYLAKLRFPVLAKA
jgi:hypothetical protein